MSRLRSWASSPEFLLFRHRQFDGVAFVLFSQGQALGQLLLELSVTHLFEDVGVAGFIHLEGLAAVRTNDVVHVVVAEGLLPTGQSRLCRDDSTHDSLVSTAGDPHALLETALVGIASIIAIGFLAGLREMAHDIRQFRRAKV